MKLSDHTGALKGEPQPYSVGCDDGYGHVVAAILGQSNTVAVYTTRDNQLRWNYRSNAGKVPPRLLPAIFRFDALLADIGTLIPSSHRNASINLLGKALFAALDGDDTAQLEHAFEGVSAFVAQVSVQRARLVYVVAFLVSAFVLGAALGLAGYYVEPASQRITVLATLCGVAGACISVLQRSATIDVDAHAGERFLALQGAARVILGALFGLFFVLASQGDLVLGVANKNISTLIPLAVVAGFSERLVPEIMERLEGSGRGSASKRGSTRCR